MNQIPVFAAIRHTLLLTFNNLGPALRITWAWMVVFAVTAGLLIWATLQVVPGEASGAIPLLIMGVIFILVALTATGSIAVAWHRYILLDEGGDAGFNLRVDGTVLRYVGNAILISLGAMIAFGVPFALLAQVSDYLLLLALPALLLLSPFMYRLFIKLPAIALERRDFGFSDALDASKGNYWQLIGLVVVYIVIALLINLVVGLASLVGLIFGPFAVVVQIIATAAAEWFGIIFGISLLTTLYGYFVEGRSFGS